MKTRPIAMLGLPLLSLLLVAMGGCGERGESGSAERVAQTRYPGMVSAGGGTSGEVMNQAKRATDGNYAGGTPGIAGGAGGNTGGPATGGTAQESGKGPAGTVAPPGGQPGGSK